jgi:3-oxoacyl-[acyl-carrier-protein] synthase II
MTGGCQTIIGSRTAGLDALGLAAARIASGHWNRAIVAAADEYSTATNSGYARCGLYSADQSSNTGTFVSGWGAAALILESSESIEARGGARKRASVRGYAARSVAAREMARAADQILTELADPPLIVSSANGTWLDRTEADAARRSGRRAGRDAAVVLPGLCWAECFSAGPLAAIAAALLCDSLPGGCRSGGRISRTSEGFAVLASDYNGLTAGARIQPEGSL